MPASTVWKVLHRHGVSRLPSWRQRADANATSGHGRASSPHIDIKRLGRFWTVGKRGGLGDEAGNRSRHAGWQYDGSPFEAPRPS